MTRRFSLPGHEAAGSADELSQKGQGGATTILRGLEPGAKNDKNRHKVLQFFCQLA